MLKYLLVGILVVVLLVSSYFAVYYYNSSQALMRRIQGATLESARDFHFSLLYATDVLESLEYETERENIRDLIGYFRDYIYSAKGSLDTLRTYLLPSYEDSLLIVEDLLWNMCVTSLGGVSNTFEHLLDLWSTNASLVTTAFKELNQVASEKIDDMGFELAEAFEALRRNGIVQTFKIIPSRMENVVAIANDLRTILNEWATKYSQM
jgi:hypothetical protein